ncbi:MAG TPA: AAC(3) family N-acetyltransferase [Anaerolineaceae bacterium]|nr:AAC(3) family N-acetyltransferase [Anaerolineaceae bacterium]
MSLSFRDLISSLTALRLLSHVPVIAHVDLSCLDEIDGGGESVLRGLLHMIDTLMMPVFTRRTMIIPAAGPENNGIVYNSRHSVQHQSEFFDPNMPSDPDMGEVAELLRVEPGALRSNHPILSFTSIGVDAALRAQTLSDPLAPLRVLAELEGWVLLAGADHTRNFSLHVAEQMAGRKTFVRWALTPDRIVELPNMPGCSRGFNRFAPVAERITRQARVGEFVLTAIPLRPMLNLAYDMIMADPNALLCDDAGCLMCNSIRQ